jgi:hypothetical protein
MFICLDELQDLLTDNIPVIEECASHSHLKIFMYSGTPKSLDNTIEYYWTPTRRRTSGPCPATTTSSRAPASRRSTGTSSARTTSARKSSSAIAARSPSIRWIRDARVGLSQPGHHQADREKPYEGFRIPQLMVPWIPYEDLKQKQHTYSRAKFYNEVLGLVLRLRYPPTHSTGRRSTTATITTCS